MFFKSAASSLKNLPSIGFRKSGGNVGLSEDLWETGGETSQSRKVKKAFLHTYALFYTFVVILIFLFPITGISFLVADPTIRYWVGIWPLWSFLWVPVLITQYFFHIRQEKPRRRLMIFCTALPALTYLMVAWSMWHQADLVQTALRFSDCESYTGNEKHLRDAFIDAKAFFDKCKDTMKADLKGDLKASLSTSSSTSSSKKNDEEVGNASFLSKSRKTHIPFRNSDLSSKLLIHHCPGYEKYMMADPSRERNWTYLREEELTNNCSGFCVVGPALWSYPHFKDNCSSAIAEVLEAKVGRSAWQIMVYCAVIIISSLLWVEINNYWIKALEQHSDQNYATEAQFLDEERRDPLQFDSEHNLGYEDDHQGVGSGETPPFRKHSDEEGIRSSRVSSSHVRTKSNAREKGIGPSRPRSDPPRAPFLATMSRNNRM